jgi:transposase-like protein
VAHPRGLFHKIKQLTDPLVFGELQVEPRGDDAPATRKAKQQRKKALWAEASWVDDGAGAADIRERAARVQDTWKGREPDAVGNFFVDFDKTLSYLAIDVPASLASLRRTTNLLERFHQERRRKQRDIGRFQSEQGCEALWYLLARRETAKQRAMLQSRV